MTKIVGSFKDKFKSLLNTKTPKQTIYGAKNKPSKPKPEKIKLTALEILLY